MRQAFDATDQPRNGPGLYMLTLKSECVLPGITASHGDILYVGKASDFKKRDHFGKRTSSCTVRRSLAVLLPVLGTVPKASGSKQPSNWDLADDGNERLTSWMRANIDITRVRVAPDKTLSRKEQRLFLEAEEQKLIAEAEPPLNLRDWPASSKNRYRAQIEAARAAFTDQIREEHKAIRSSGAKSRPA